MSARKKSQGVAYLRRSTDKQEASLEMQLNFACREAARLAVRLDASTDDLDHMQRNGLRRYKDIFLDDSLSALESGRPAQRELISTLESSTTISHLFCNKRDRLGRPENPLALALIEYDLRIAGITLVFSDGVAEPMERGNSDFGQLVTMVYGYQQGHDELVKLADRMVETFVKLANDGFRTGGIAPYGFVRALVNSDGKILEILPPGKRVVQSGCHVIVVPDPSPEGVRNLVIRMRIVDWRLQHWGWKRIAKTLNKMGIPSPAAGSTRTDHGVKHKVSGLWCVNSVKNLCLGPELVGLQEFGRRSEGVLRRIGQNGPRLLTDADRDADGRARTVLNPDSSLIVRPTGVEPLISVEQRRELLAIQDQRSKTQRGVPRTRDPGENPLSCRVIDLTNDCGSPMYARKSGKRRMLTCGRYIVGGATACDHNQIDADAAFRFVIKALRQRIGLLGKRPQLEKLIRERAFAQKSSAPVMQNERVIACFRDQIATMDRDLKTARRRILREEDDGLAGQLKQDYQEMVAEQRVLQRDLQSVQTNSDSHEQRDPEADVADAMILFDEIDRITRDPHARADAAALFAQLNLRLGLTFVGATKGKRKVRVLQSGVMVFGAAELPVKMYGRNNAEDAGFANTGTPAKDGAHMINGKEESGQRGRPAGAVNCSKEDVSYQKVHRGDRI